MRIRFIIIGLFISLTVYGATDSLVTSNFMGGMYFGTLLLFMIVFSIIQNHNSKDVKEIKPLISTLITTMQTINNTNEHINNNILSLQSEKMIYANRTQILNIIKTNLDLCEFKITTYGFNLKNNINLGISNQSVEQQNKYRVSISNFIKVEKNFLVTNTSLFKYAEANIDDMLILLFKTDDLVEIVMSYIFSDKDINNFKMEINSFFNEILNKFII